MKIAWFSNSPFAATGYGNQTKLFTPLLKSLGYDVEILAFFGHENYCAPINWNGIRVSGRGFDVYGRDVIVDYYNRSRSDLMLTLIDAWIFDPQITRMMRWVPWFPVDSDPIPPAVLEAVRYAFRRIVYSRFAERQLNDYDLDCFYVPHGVDTQIFKRLPSRDRARNLVGLPKGTESSFVVGMVAANKGYPSRKAFEQNISAFKMLTEKHNDAILWLQTWAGDNGAWGQNCVNLVEYCRQIGLQLGKNVFFCDQFVNVTTGFPDEFMVSLYNAFDVLLNVSRGEGFGIPIMEAAACGTPSIVGDWTSMSEVCVSGWKVSKQEADLDPTWQKTFQYLPRVGAIYDRLEAAYQMRDNEDYKQRARDGAMQYDIRKVTEKFWKPTLASIAEHIAKIEELKKVAVASAPAPAPSTDSDSVAATGTTLPVEEITA